MQGEPIYTGLTVDAYRLEDQGRWSFGVTMGGTYVELVSRKLGGVDSDLETAALAAAHSSPPPPAPTTQETQTQ